MTDYNFLNKETGELEKLSRADAWQIAEDKITATQSAEEKTGIMAEYLKGIHGHVELGAQTQRISAYSDSYNDKYTKDERKEKIKTKGTELWQKEINAVKIEKEEENRSRKNREKARDAAEALRVSTRSAHVKALSAFMKSSSRYDRRLLRNYIGEDTRLEALKECIRVFMSTDLTRINVSSEKKIAENVEELERFSERFAGIQYLISQSPELYRSLEDGERKAFEDQMGKANVVVSYYRLKKRIMTDGYYRGHENSEIGRKTDKNNSAHQRYLSEMLWQAEGG
ncbi:MAG: hypothetical protein K6G42_05585, partial [Lachnospiraceae bacterium]|nr:hypothetical protein [Lachnospiraceae bacterium]